MKRGMELFTKQLIFILILFVGFFLNDNFDSLFIGWVLPAIVFTIALFVFDLFFELKERKVGGKRSG